MDRRHGSFTLTSMMNAETIPFSGSFTVDDVFESMAHNSKPGQLPEVQQIGTSRIDHLRENIPYTTANREAVSG